MLAITCTEADGEYELTIDGDGELEGECHVLLILTRDEALQLGRAIQAGLQI